jgi:hypothetical protein
MDDSSGSSIASEQFDLRLSMLRVCLVGILLWLLQLISRKPNQTKISQNALMGKATRK